MRSARSWTSTGRPTALAGTEYLLLSYRTRQVFETDAGTARKPSNRPACGNPCDVNLGQSQESGVACPRNQRSLVRAEATVLSAGPWVKP
jgi:hypothetical protein